MAFEKICPICGFELASPEEENCSQCDADLTCFNVLNSIPDKPGPDKPGPDKPGPDKPGPEELRASEENREKRPSRKQLIPIAFFLLFVGLIMGFCLASLYKSDHPPISVSYHQALPVRIKITGQAVSERADADEHPGRKVPALSRTMTEKKPEVSEGIPKEAAENLRERPTGKDLTAVPVAGQENFQVYEATDDDTLWRISKKQYGSGFYFPVIMECNPGLRVYHVQKGIQVRIFKDPAMAEKLYNENACIEGDRVYYDYKVLEGDTFESIALKFYKQGNMKHRIMDLNPHVKLRAGMRIKIALE